jgi:hypothetical protein
MMQTSNVDISNIRNREIKIAPKVDPKILKKTPKTITKGIPALS